MSAAPEALANLLYRCTDPVVTRRHSLHALAHRLQSHGFWGILLLAAYPNAAFDLCGICCGHFQMPFWEFFGATLIGKGAIKASPERGAGC